MEAEFLVTAWRSPSYRASVRRAVGGCIAMAARLVVLSIALAPAGCTDDVENAATSSPASSGTSSVTPATPLVLSGAPPASVTVGNSYNYQPTVSSGSGTISFSIQGQPAWSSFDPQTGTLTGTPTAADVGLSGEITITGANNVNTASVGPFTIEVNPASNPAPGTGSATLTWSPPTENSDGSPLTDLTGYRVHYGTSEVSLNQTIDLADAGATTYVVNDLGTGTYYFAVGAYNSVGLEGPWSNIASKTL
jgi:hypothetical protein